MHAFATVKEFTKMLHNLDAWLVKATEYAKAKSFDVNVLVTSRLAADMYSLDKQVQSACDSAKFTAAYLSNKQPPAHPDTEKTFEELHARIKSCLAFVEAIKESEYAGADERKVAPKWMQGKWMTGREYLAEAAMPNFFFHVTTAYAILRHNGVPLGKMDYLGSMPMRDA